MRAALKPPALLLDFRDQGYPTLDGSGGQESLN